jgi:hypothetical protein
MSRQLFAVAALAVVALVPAGRAAAGTYQSFTGKDWEGQYQSATECKKCHTRPTGADVLEQSGPFVLLTEYAIWKTHDKHAQAYAVLLGTRGQAMQKILGKSVTDDATGCMNCHAMSNLFGKRKGEDRDKDDGFDGVSCTGCHGPSRKWVKEHDNADDPKAWRLKSPKEKADLGFRDLRDPEIKAALCMSCHVGNADEGKVVTHAMFAAGHPPLPPIEIATFTRNEPQHWRDAKDVPLFLPDSKFMQKRSEEERKQIRANYHLESVPFERTQLALVGGVVALRQTMKLAADRANLQTEDPARLWPELLLGEGAPEAKDAREPAVVKKLQDLAQERWPDIAMAHSDCYGCHHDLRYPGFRQERGFGYHLAGRPVIRTIPGRPTIRDWPLALLEPSIQLAGKSENSAALEKALQALAATCDARPFGEPQRIRKDSGELITWAGAVLPELQSDPSRYTKDTTRDLLLLLCRLYDRPAAADGSVPLPDYETARQIASVIDVLHEELAAQGGGSPAVAQVMKALSDELDLQPYLRRSDRLKVILKVVKDIADDQQLKGLDEFTDYLQPNNIGKPELLKKLIKNPFLRALQEEVTNDKFTKGLLKKEVIDELQRLSNEELQAELDSINKYDPKEFLANLRKLDQLLGGKQ